ncbi:MAG: hypothetical protein JNL11_05320 [Bdellovibrionaceae bacterium]|nr:hypothetical protein [Pseudobdellovibrionaceae bacterium]
MKPWEINPNNFATVSSNMKTLRKTLVFSLVVSMTSVALDTPTNDLYDEKTEFIIVADPEGRPGNIEELQKQKIIDFKDGKISPRANQVIKGLGDFVDRGASSLWLQEIMEEAMRSGRSGNSYVWGNRDLNKLLLLRDLYSLRRMEIPGYVEYLKKKAQDAGVVLPKSGTPSLKEYTLKKISEFNTEANQLDWWMNWAGSRQAIENHRIELEKHKTELEAKSGKTFTKDEAAADYLRRVHPGGEFYEFLRKGNFLDRFGSNRQFISSHAGISEYNFGQIPGEYTQISNYDEWIEKLNKWAHSELDKIATQVKKGEKPKSYLFDVADAIWDPTISTAMAFDYSLTYGVRYRDGKDNLFAPHLHVSAAMAKQGIKMQIEGHTPVGNIPLFLQSSDKTFVLMADTSAPTAKFGDKSTVRIIGSRVLVTGYIDDGTPVKFTVNLKQPGISGMKTMDGLTVVKLLHPRKGKEYLVYGYNPNGKKNGYEIFEQLVSKDYIENLRANGLLQYSESPKDRMAYATDILEKAIPVLEKKKIKVLSPDELSEHQYMKGRFPIGIFGSSKFLPDEAVENGQRIEASLKALLERGAHQNAYLTSGGNDPAVGDGQVKPPETMAHELAKANGMYRHGFPASIASPQEINLVHSVTYSGVGWNDPVTPHLEHIKKNNGIAIFISGGGVIDKAIKEAIRLQVPFLLMDKVGGNSTKWATEFKSKGMMDVVFHGSEEILEKARKLVPHIFTESTNVRVIGKGSRKMEKNQPAQQKVNNCLMFYKIGA